MGKYDDIINLKRPESKHPKMSMTDRAGQFAPFAALTGYGDAISETADLSQLKYVPTDEDRKLIEYS